MAAYLIKYHQHMLLGICMLMSVPHLPKVVEQRLENEMTVISITYVRVQKNPANTMLHQVKPGLHVQTEPRSKCPHLTWQIKYQ